MNRPCDECLDNDATTKVDDNYYCEDCDVENILGAGKLEIWYMRPECFRDYGSFSDQRPDPKNMEATHILLASVASCSVKELDNLWVKMQGESWSPNGEANNLIRSKGLQHTSMSVGDCFRFANGDVFRVASDGFTKLV